MVSKAFGVYTGNGADAVTNAWSVLGLDTNVQQDTGFTRATNVVTQDETALVLVILSASFEDDGNGDSPSILLQLQVDTGSGYVDVPGGYCITGYTLNEGVNEGTAFGHTFVDGTAGDKYRLRARCQNTGDTSDSITNKVSVQFLQMPSSFNAAILSHGGAPALSSSFSDDTYNTTIRLDSRFTLNTSSGTGIVPDAAGRYLCLFAMPIRLDTAPSGGPTEGALDRVRISVNGTDSLYGQGRKVHQWEINPGSDAVVLGFIPLDLSASDIVRTNSSGNVNKGDGSDVENRIANVGVFALVEVDAATPADDWFQIRRSATTTTGFQTLQQLAWDRSDEGSASFTHSTVTNNERVTFPTAKVLTLAHLSFFNQATTDVDVAYHANFRKDGTTVLDYGRGGSGINLTSAGSAPSQHHTNVQAAMLIDAAGEYYEVQWEPIGTDTDTGATMSGDDIVAGTLWWGVNVNDWPDDTVTGTGAGSTSLPTSAAAGLVGVTGTGAGSTSLPTAVGVGTASVTGTGAGSFVLAAAAAVGLVTATGTSSGSTSLPTAAAVGVVTVTGTSAGSTSLPTSAATGLVTVTATGAGSTSLPTSSAPGLVGAIGTGTLTLPLVQASGVGMMESDSSSPRAGSARGGSVAGGLARGGAVRGGISRGGATAGGMAR